MHEVSIMEAAAEAAEATARREGAARIITLRLRVGAMSGVVPEALRFAFDVVAAQSPLLAGATMEIETVPAVCWCATCAAEFSGADWINECPRCHNPSGELRQGRELEIASVELEEA